MVFKVSKAGVRSGNTLRRVQSRRTKLYGQHACLIGSSSLGRHDLDNLIRKSSEEDDLVGDTLKRTDVLLSLNKKQRWRVPGMVNQMISSGNFNKSAMISLLERHKLKRRANCVRFSSNGGRLPNVEPKQKKYFSFSLDTIDQNQSNREKKRIRAEKFKHDINMKDRVQTTKSKIKMIHTYTIDGKVIADAERHKELEIESSKKEYRLEVFYPCPQSCSLTFNPKYTDVVLEEGKSGKLEVKSNVKAPRNGQKHHRHRFTIRDFDEVDNETVEDDVNEMWNNCQDSDSEETSLHEYENKIQTHQYFEMLINKAENAQKLLIRQRRPHKAKKVDTPNWENNKSHIVYIDHKKGEYNTNSSSTQAFDSNTSYLKEIEPLDSIKVILESSETSEEFLQQKYGSMYSEANCYPRRFMINITDDVANWLSSTKSLSKDVLFMSYLVFIHDGIYDEGLEVFRVVFNSYSCKNAHNLSQYISFSLMTFDEIMKGIIGYLLDLKEKKELRYHDLHFSKNIKVMYNFLYNRINLNVKSFKPSNALSEKGFESLDEENLKLEKELNRLTTSFDEDVFCDICYDVINATKIDAVYGTKLAKCGHHCCDRCWASHFQSRMRNGLTTMSCPGYNCSSEIGLVTLLSLIDVSDVALLFQRRAEEEVEEAENSKWCPNPDCGHVIKVDSSSKDFCQDVVCACGTEICFACFGSAHWPAKCVQAEDYLEKLTTIKPPKENVEEPDIKPIITQSKNKIQVFNVEGRVCPRCNRFINKNGGCPNMICKCDYHFCWNCMKSSHDTACKIDSQFLLEHTRLIRVHHISQTNSASAMPSVRKEPKINYSKQKATLYQRALQQRLESSKSKSSQTCKKLLKLMILSAACKDLQFKKEIIITMEHQAVPDNEDQLIRMNIKPSVDQLITSSQDIKRVLHHVAEFSYVLLQGTQHSVEKQRILRLANDISGICSFFSSIIDLGDNQDAKTAFHRLISIQEWAKRALDALIAATRRLRQQ